MVVVAAWEAISAGASLVAAVAALMTIKLAHDTVIEARVTRAEAGRAHAETIAEQARHAIEIADAAARDLQVRAQALEAELEVQRLVATGRIATTLAAMADIAREEITTPPPVVTAISPLPLTRLAGILGTLKVQVALLTALGGPDIPRTADLAEHGYLGGAQPSHYLGRAVEALREVELVLAGHEGLEVRNT